MRARQLLLIRGLWVRVPRGPPCLTCMFSSFDLGFGSPSPSFGAVVGNGTAVAVLLELTLPLSDDHARQVEERVLPRAGRQDQCQLRQSVRRAVLKIDPDGAAERQQRRRKDREVTLQPREDGMADLASTAPPTKSPPPTPTSTTTPGPPTAAAPTTTNAPWSRSARTPPWTCSPAASSPPVPRPGTGGGGAEVHVVVGLATLLGLNNDPAELEGYGPITAELAREIAGDATWRRLITDPQSGTLSGLRPDDLPAAEIAGRSRHRPRPTLHLPRAPPTRPQNATSTTASATPKDPTHRCLESGAAVQATPPA